LGNLIHFHSWNYMMRESSTFRILPNNPYVADGAQALKVGAVVSQKGGKVLGVAGTALSVINDPSPKNIIMNGLPWAVPELRVPFAFGGAAWAGSKFVSHQVIDKVFVPDASQSDTIPDGNGHNIPSPQSLSDCEDWSVC
jgi:hypothetical protein